MRLRKFLLLVLAGLPVGLLITPAASQPADVPYKLGLKPEPAGKLRVKAHWKNGAVPPSPDKVDHHAGWKFNLGRNNEFGTCGPTSAANHKQMTDKFLFGKDTFVPFDQIADLYRRSGNPRFNPDVRGGVQDNGVVMSDLLDAMDKNAFGDNVVAYASLADMSDPSLYAAIDRFGGVLFAVNLQTAQQRQTDNGYWDYQRSGPWGGHAILGGKYDKTSGRVSVVTWGKEVWMTPSFRRYQLSEVWLPIWESSWKAGKYWKDGLDTAQFAKDWEAITGKTLPPMPKQDPAPDPKPDPKPDPQPPPYGDKVRVDIPVGDLIAALEAKGYVVVNPKDPGKLPSEAEVRLLVKGVVAPAVDAAFPGIVKVGGTVMADWKEALIEALVKALLDYFLNKKK